MLCKHKVTGSSPVVSKTDKKLILKYKKTRLVKLVYTSDLKSDS